VTPRRLAPTYTCVFSRCAASRDFIRQSGKSLEAQRVAAKEDKDTGKKKKKNAGRGVEGKYVYAVQEVSKYIDGDKPLFEDVSFQIFQGYARLQQRPTLDLLFLTSPHFSCVVLEPRLVF
jgi:hypothetical protein